MKSERLKELVIKSGKTQKDIADELNLTQQRFNFYVNGVREPDNDTLCIIAEYFNVSADYLLGRTNDPINYNDPELIANLAGPLLERFNGNVRKAYKFQKAVESDAKIDEYNDFEIEMLEKLSAQGYKYHELNERVDPTIIIYKDNFSKIYKMNDLVPNFIKYKNSESVVETILNVKCEEDFAEPYQEDIETIAAHHDGEEFTEEELEAIEKFKELIRNNKRGK